MTLIQADERTSDRTPDYGSARFWAVIGVVTATQLALRGWAAGGGWFFADDFWWHDIVARNTLWETAGLSLGGHFSPLTYIPYWVLTSLFPYDWGSRVVVMLVTLLAINLGVLSVCRRLWHSRGPQLVVYVLWAFSSLAAPSWLWYSQFSMLGALLLTSTWTLWAYLRALQSSRRGPSLLAVALLAASLFAQERMLITAVLAMAFLVLVCRPAVRLAGSGRGPLWGGSLVVLALWAAVYSSLPASDVIPAPLPDASGLAVRMVGTSALPAMLGGPWFLQEGAVFARAETPLLAQVLAVTLVAAVVGWSLRRNVWAWRPWAVLGAGILVDAMLIAVTRGVTLGEAAVGDFRYFSDLAVLAPLLIVSAFVPPGTQPEFRPVEQRVIRTSLVVYVLAATVTTLGLGSAWQDSRSRTVVQNAQAALESSGPISLMDRVMPTTVVNPELMQQRLASRVFSIIDTDAAFDTPTTDPWWIDDQGNLVPGGLVETRSALGGGTCLLLLQGVDTVWVELPKPKDLYDWGLRIDYSAGNAPTPTLGITDGRRSVSVPVDAGTQSLYVPFPGIADRVGLFVADPQASLCVRGVIAGKAGPGR